MPKVQEGVSGVVNTPELTDVISVEPGRHSCIR